MSGLEKKGQHQRGLLVFARCLNLLHQAELLLQMGPSEWKRTGRGGREADEGVVCAKMSIWDIIMGLVLKHTFFETFGLPSLLLASVLKYNLVVFQEMTSGLN